MGSNGTILATTNGGVTWKAQKSGTSTILTGVAFTTASHGWVAGFGTILTTTNGGVT